MLANNDIQQHHKDKSYGKSNCSDVAVLACLG